MANIAKLYPKVVQTRRTIGLGLCALFLAGAALLQGQIDPIARQYHVGEASLGRASAEGLNSEFLLLPLLGFREAAAGLLWVRCDEFFHSGDYDAILPLVRLITWLDPHAENVYVTGSWHLSYNFTDANERSDRRYLAPSQALLDEGIVNNPNIPDIKFEKGWQNYDKIKDYNTAETAFLSAIKGPHGDETGVKGSDDYPYASPLKTLHILAHTYEKEGRIPEALMQWKAAMKRSSADLAAKPTDYSLKQLSAAEHHNYDETLQRWHNRYTTTGHDAINPTKYPFVLLPPPTGDQTPRPWDCAFVPKVEVVRPRVFKISGQFNAADGARIDVRITDWDFKDRNTTSIEHNARFEVDQTQTILVDALSERKNHFERELDMSKDPKMYNFSQPYYRVTLGFNPRGTSPHLQDRQGWSGEGLTDINPQHVMLDARPKLLGTKLIEGQGASAGPVWDGKSMPWPDHAQPVRIIRVTYKISKDQVMNLKPISEADQVPNEPIK